MVGLAHPVWSFEDPSVVIAQVDCCDSQWNSSSGKNLADRLCSERGCESGLQGFAPALQCSRTLNQIGKS